MREVADSDTSLADFRSQNSAVKSRALLRVQNSVKLGRSAVNYGLSPFFTHHEEWTKSASRSVNFAP